MMNKNKQSKQTQIRRKLAQSGITKPEEFEQIISNLIGQRDRLYADLSTLREKVATLQQKQAQRLATRNLRKRSSAPKNHINYRQELNKKYEELKYWQKLSLKAMKNSRVQIQYRAFLDKLNCLERQIQATLKELNDEYIINKRLTKAFKLNMKDEKNANHPHESIETENHNLKKRIFSMKKMVDEQANKEIYLHNYLIEIKQKDRDSRLKEREIQSRQRRTSTELRRSIARVRTQANKSSIAETYTNLFDEIVDFQFIPNQVATEDEIYQVEGRLNRIESKFRASINDIEMQILKNYSNGELNEKRQGSKLTYGKQFEIIIQNVKARLDTFSELNKKKIQLYLQLKEHPSKVNQSVITNKSIHKKKLTTQIHFTEREAPTPIKKSRIRSVTLENQLNFTSISSKKAYIQSLIQTQSHQFKDTDPLRKQFIGEINECSFFDRNLLRQQRHTSIKSLEIYYSDRGISTIRAFYTIHTNNTIKNSQVMISDQFIKNYCQIHVIDTNSDDFIRYFKVRYNTVQNRLTQIKIVTNKNLKNGWGDAKIKGEDLQIDENIEKQIVFDINQDEYPVSIFCSHIQKGPYWYLCGFGVQINDL